MADWTVLRGRWRAALQLLRAEGPAAVASAVRAAWRREREVAAADYPRWARTYPPRALAGIDAMHGPLISVIMPVRDTPAPWLRAAIDSVLAQSWPHWELCIADDASTASHTRRIIEEYRARDARIKVAFRSTKGDISAASNTALSLAGGELVAFLDHDDELAHHALARVAAEASSSPGVAMIYSDEDKLDARGERTYPNFKPDWNPELFLSHNLAAHLAVYRAELVRAAGGLREGFEGAQDYDLALRIAEAVEPWRIRHIPEVLYHWRMVPGSTAVTTFEKEGAALRARRAVEEHLARSGIAADVETLASLGAQRIRYRLTGAPPRWDVVRAAGPRERNRSARSSAGGDYLIFLSPGVEPEDDAAIEELVRHAQRAGVGAVGGKLVALGRVVHAGTFLGAGHAHRGRPRTDPGYMMRAALAQEMSIVSGDCLCVRRALFEQAGGFDERLERAFQDVDFCLRLGSMGSRNVFTPYAGFSLEGGALALPGWDAEAAARFPQEAARLRERWGGKLDEDPHYNPNLSLAPPAFSLAWPPRT